MSFAGLMRGDRDFLKNPVEFKNTYVNKLQDAFDKRRDTSSEIESDEIYAKENKAFNDRFKKQNTKGFLDKAIAGGLDYFDKTKDKEKTDADKLIDFYKKQSGQAQFGGAGSGSFEEVAQGFRYGQLPAQSQQMYIPGDDPKGKTIGQRIAGGAAGLLQGLSTGIPHAGGIGLVAGLLG